MGYYLYDSRGYLDDGPSTRGLEDLHAWARMEPVPQLLSFINEGQTRDIDQLVKALNVAYADDASVESSRIALLAAARKAEDVLILSDGTGEDDGEEDESDALTLVGLEWNEDDHPRDESGKFAAIGAADAGFPADDAVRVGITQMTGEPDQAEWKAIFKHDRFLDELDEGNNQGNLDRYDQDQYDALQEYVGGQYSNINARLRQQPDFMDDEDEDEVDDGTSDASRVSALSDLISSAPALKEPVTVYRGIGPGAGHAIYDAQPGDRLQLNGFQSTSFDPQVALRFGGAFGGPILEIRADSGLALGHAHSIENEMEFIIDHGETYHVVGRKTVSFGDHTRDVLQVVQGSLMRKLREKRGKK